MRIARTVAVFLTTTVATATLAVASPGTAFADDSTTTASEVVAALNNVDTRTNLVQDAAPSSAVTISSDPKQGVQVALPNGQKMSVGLPNAKNGGKGTKILKGAVAYSGRNGSANAAIPTANGVQLLTTIEGRKAPTR